MLLKGSRKEMLSMLLKSSGSKESSSPLRGEGVGHAAGEQQDEESTMLPKRSRSCPCC